MFDRLTARGQDREYQRQNDSLRVEAFGVLMKTPNGGCSIVFSTIVSFLSFLLTAPAAELVTLMTLAHILAFP
jgi:transposase